MIYLHALLSSLSLGFSDYELQILRPLFLNSTYFHRHYLQSCAAKQSIHNYNSLYATLPLIKISNICLCNDGYKPHKNIIPFREHIPLLLHHLNLVNHPLPCCSSSERMQRGVINDPILIANFTTLPIPILLKQSG